MLLRALRAQEPILDLVVVIFKNIKENMNVKIRSEIR